MNPKNTLSSPNLSRSFLLVFSILSSLAFLPSILSAQSTGSVVKEARDKLIEMYSGVDHFMVKTDSFTSYNRIVTKDGKIEMETQIGAGPGGGMSGVTSNPVDQLDALAEHGVYKGTKDIEGVTCHVIYVDDPSKIDPQLAQGDTVTYYIGADDALIQGMDMSMNDGTSMKMRMKDYQNYDGILYPNRMEITMVQMDAARQQQLKQLEEQLKQMPESMRKQMQDQIDQAMGMLSGEPMIVKTEEVVVDGPLPAGVFDK